MDNENQEFQYADDSQQSSDAGQTTENTHGEEQTTTSLKELADLSAYERFKLGDKELTRDQLEKGIMYQSDYTKKTQEIAQERKFYTNLQADLDKVAKNPALADSFREVYPKNFHYLVGYVSRGTQTSNSATQTQGQQNAVDPRLEKLDSVFKTVEELQKERYEEKVAQRATEIDSAFSKFSSKYPLATPNGDETYVLNKAQAMLERGDKLDTETWEKIFKDSEMHFKKAFETHYKTINQQQKAAHVRGKEIGSGGGVPGGAPQMPRTIKAASRIAEEDLGRR